ncbi:MAG: phosphonate C-P lyase system protein PhnG [Zoogloeaceae bacterium]|jgi:alpha-D-ribose 1-methylphosphonate 5-triphosphate synthase subunit PhnG|nr:phosphonate C-P lyase system protein PhnG [Zoogloeaceae bacterium]
MTFESLPCRTDWPRLLGAAPAEALEAVAGQLAAAYAVEDLSLPQAGLGLLQLADGALADAYYLGEIPLSCAHVRLTAPDGQVGTGAAHWLDDQVARTRAMAIVDAALSARLPGSEAALPLLAAGQAALARTKAERRQLLSATRVDFSLLGMKENDAEEDDDDC